MATRADIACSQKANQNNEPMQSRDAQIFLTAGNGPEHPQPDSYPTSPDGECSSGCFRQSPKSDDGNPKQDAVPLPPLLRKFGWQIWESMGKIHGSGGSEGHRTRKRRKRHQSAEGTNYSCP